MTLPNALLAKLTILAACLLALALLVHDRNRWKSTATLRQQQVVAEKAAHSATVANYRAAADQAREADAANAARVQREQDKINERIADDFESRITAARAHAERLRSQAAGAAADPGSPAAAPVPRLPAAASGIAEAAGEDGFPHRDRLIATEQAIQLDELIRWVRSQGKVPPDGK